MIFFFKVFLKAKLWSDFVSSLNEFQILELLRLDHCMPPDREIYNFSLNFHHNGTKKWIVILWKFDTKKCDQNCFKTSQWLWRIMGEKEVNMEQSTLDFWSEFH